MIKRGKLYRREKIDLELFSKGVDYRKKVKMFYNRKKNIRRRISEYGESLIKIRKLRIYYCISYKCLKNTVRVNKIFNIFDFDRIIPILERRFDNILYRMGFSSTRKSARQFICHKHISINNKIINHPGKLINNGDVISVTKNSKIKSLVADSIKKRLSVSTFYSIDLNNLSGTLLGSPVSNFKFND